MTGVTRLARGAAPESLVRSDTTKMAAPTTPTANPTFDTFAQTRELSRSDFASGLQLLPVQCVFALEVLESERIPATDPTAMPTPPSPRPA